MRTVSAADTAPTTYPWAIHAEGLRVRAGRHLAVEPLGDGHRRLVQRIVLLVEALDLVHVRRADQPPVDPVDVLPELHHPVPRDASGPVPEIDGNRLLQLDRALLLGVHGEDENSWGRIEA